MFSRIHFGQKKGAAAAKELAAVENVPPDIPWAWVKKVQHIVDNPPQGASLRPLPVEILPWLYLSDHRSVLDTRNLVERGITHVLSVNHMFEPELHHLSDQLRTKQIIHHHEPGEDREGYDMIGLHWPACCKFIQTACFDNGNNDNTTSTIPNNNNKVVVHCSAGINRSGLIVAAAYMIFTNTPVLEVVHELVQKRGLVLWNRYFQMQLCILAAKHDLLGDTPPATTEYLSVIPRSLPPPPMTTTRFNNPNRNHRDTAS
jgi:Dual specificity phosphatase, catalytic domain